jgi:hypothetical protein
MTVLALIRRKVHFRFVGFGCSRPEVRPKADPTDGEIRAWGPASAGPRSGFTAGSHKRSLRR